MRILYATCFVVAVPLALAVAIGMALSHVGDDAGTSFESDDELFVPQRRAERPPTLAAA